MPLAHMASSRDAPQTANAVGGDARSADRSLPRDLEPQILPMRIALRDQIDLVLPPIGFEGFLTRNRYADLIIFAESSK